MLYWWWLYDGLSLGWEHQNCKIRCYEMHRWQDAVVFLIANMFLYNIATTAKWLCVADAEAAMNISILQQQQQQQMPQHNSRDKRYFAHRKEFCTQEDGLQGIALGLGRKAGFWGISGQIHQGILFGHPFTADAQAQVIRPFRKCLPLPRPLQQVVTISKVTWPMSQGHMTNVMEGTRQQSSGEI